MRSGICMGCLDEHEIQNTFMESALFIRLSSHIVLAGGMDIAFLFACLWKLCSCTTYRVYWRLPTGGSPAATYLSCFAKKGKPKKATALPLPLRGSRLCRSKNGKRPQLATLRQGRFFIHFLPCTIGSARSGISKSKATTKHRRSTICKSIYMTVALFVVVDLQPLGTQPFVCCEKWIRKVRCLSEASFELFPFFTTYNREPAGQRRCGRASAAPFFCLLFLWRDKEK